MIDCYTQVVGALKTVLPTYYEMALTKGVSTPCISYQGADNYETNTGNTLAYSKVGFIIKVWATSVADIQKYSIQVDAALRPLGLRRTHSEELHDNNSTMIQKILNYEAYALENY